MLHPVHERETHLEGGSSAPPLDEGKTLRWIVGQAHRLPGAQAGGAPALQQWSARDGGATRLLCEWQNAHHFSKTHSDCSSRPPSNGSMTRRPSSGRRWLITRSSR